MSLEKSTSSALSSLATSILKHLGVVADTAKSNLVARVTLLATDESGMSTVEYAIGTVAAAAFGAILYTVVTGDSIVSALTNIIGRALNTKV